MLDPELLLQVKDIFSSLDGTIVLRAQADPSHEGYADFHAFLTDFVATSPRLALEETAAEGRLQFSLVKDGAETGIVFRGVPGGHEFSSLLLAVLNADGKGRNLPDESLTRRIRALQGPLRMTTYVSLSCTNCPDVVQALNVIALLHPSIEHEIVDGGLFPEEVEARRLQGVPAVFVGDRLIHSGRGDLSSLLDMLENEVGSQAEDDAQPLVRHYDVLVVGGGPAGSAAAIYSARKGLRVAMVAERIGGQVKETVGIENLISVPRTSGAQLAADLALHIAEYAIDVWENRRIEAVDFSTAEKRVQTVGGEVFVAPAVVLATGAGWRRLGVAGETEHLGRGVHFCPHCDGPFYKNKDVAVVGGGNSGIEAAIDLAGIARKVTVLEFADTLRADSVLQDKARTLPNVEIFTSSRTTEVVGEGGRVKALRVENRLDGTERTLPLDGVFVQIGLSPNTKPFAESLTLNERGEIPVDRNGRTAVAGVYAAGDVTDVAYKQIIVAMGEGAKAALAAFDDRIRGTI